MVKSKYIFITGGVASSLGKGVTVAGLGCLLEARGYKVALQKMDPYINIDPGTMFLYDSCFTIIGLVHSALMPEMTESLEERSKLQVSSSLFGLLGTLLGFIIPDLVRPKAGSADTSLWPLRLAMIGLVLVFGLCDT